MEPMKHNPLVQQPGSSSAAPRDSQPNLVPGRISEAAQDSHPDAKTFMDIAIAFGLSASLANLRTGKPIQQPVLRIEAMQRDHLLPIHAMSRAVARIEQHDPWAIVTIPTENVREVAGNTTHKPSSALPVVFYTRAGDNPFTVTATVEKSDSDPRKEAPGKDLSVTDVDVPPPAGGNSGKSKDPQINSGLSHNQESAKINLLPDLFGDQAQGGSRSQFDGENFGGRNWHGYPSGIGAPELGIMLWVSMATTICTVFYAPLLPLAIASNALTALVVSKDFDEHRLRIALAHDDYVRNLEMRHQDTRRLEETAAMGAPLNQRGNLPNAEEFFNLNSIKESTPQRPDGVNRERGRWSRTHTPQYAHAQAKA